MNEAHSYDTEAHEAFLAYVEAKALADRTLNFSDAKAAANAWVAFINLFMEPGDRMPAGNIIPFRKRGL